MKHVDSFRTARWIRLINLLLQAVLFLTLFGGLNYLALNNSWRFDLTKSRRHSLSAETESYLKRLEQPVRIVVTFTDDAENHEVAQAFRDLTGLMREYSYSSRNNATAQITVTFLDVYQRRKEAEELGIEQPNAVVVISGERRRTVTIEELYRIKNKVTREAFRGESALTAAILDVTSTERKKIYFVQGHGELQPDDVSERGISVLRDALRQRNFDLAALDLAQLRRVPEDAALVMVIGQQGRFQRFEEELLRDYLQTRAGRVVLMLDPMRQHGLDMLLFDWGVIAYDNLIYEPASDYSSETGELLLRNFLRHPITETLINNQLPVLVGSARVISADPGAPIEDGISVQTLVVTGSSAWGETNYRMRIPPQYTPGQDLRGQLGVLVIAERTKPANNLPLSVRGGRLAVFGTSDLATNNRIINVGNLNLFLSTVNWTTDRDTQLNIPARPIERFQLTLSQEELSRLRLGLLLIVPGTAALLGLLVYWTRRN
ncbi:MAG: GldG family protein [Candidatus Didemnitutus sp.]|nr:GldG family protein [Candidatus Didemnitutus sp.]